MGLLHDQLCKRKTCNIVECTQLIIIINNYAENIFNMTLDWPTFLTLNIYPWYPSPPLSLTRHQNLIPPGERRNAGKKWKCWARRGGGDRRNQIHQVWHTISCSRAFPKLRLTAKGVFYLLLTDGRGLGGEGGCVD